LNKGALSKHALSQLAADPVRIRSLTDFPYTLLSGK
jgi:hypothetical protein